MDVEIVKQMRRDLYRAHRYEDPQIISHWANVHKDLSENRLFMVRPPKAIATKLIEKGSPLVDAGDFPSIGHYISRIVKDFFTPKKEQKSNGFWG